MPVRIRRYLPTRIILAQDLLEPRANRRTHGGNMLGHQQCQALAAAGGGQRPGFTMLVTQPESATAAAVSAIHRQISTDSHRRQQLARLLDRREPSERVSGREPLPSVGWIFTWTNRGGSLEPVEPVLVINRRRAAMETFVGLGRLSFGFPGGRLHWACRPDRSRPG